MSSYGVPVREGRCRRALVIAAAMLLLVVSLPSLAGADPVSGGPVPGFTGCLNTNSGMLSNLQAAATPLRECPSGHVQVVITGDVLAAVLAGTGLEAAAGPRTVTLGLRQSYQQPQGCADGNVPKWNSTRWACAEDRNTTYTAGVGLALDGTQFGVDFSALRSRFVSNNQSCATGFVTGFDTLGALVCDEPSAAGTEITRDVAFPGAALKITNTGSGHGVLANATAATGSGLYAVNSAGGPAVTSDGRLVLTQGHALWLGNDLAASSTGTGALFDGRGHPITFQPPGSTAGAGFWGPITFNDLFTASRLENVTLMEASGPVQLTTPLYRILSPLSQFSGTVQADELLAGICEFNPTTGLCDNFRADTLQAGICEFDATNGSCDSFQADALQAGVCQLDSSGLSCDGRIVANSASVGVCNFSSSGGSCRSFGAPEAQLGSCHADSDGISCDAVDAKRVEIPRFELCDARDRDCDGVVDEVSADAWICTGSDCSANVNARTAFVGGCFIGGGTISCSGGKSFRIQHPFDPSKWLYHAAVESPELTNVYTGNVTTDDRGIAVVRLPAYFEAVNRDFRYQLTVIGRFAQAIVGKEIEGNRFTIRTSKPRVKVSWQVTALRNDAYARAHPFQAEVSKQAP